MGIVVLTVTLAPIGETGGFAEDPGTLAATLENGANVMPLARMALFGQAIGCLSRLLTRQFEV